MPRYFLDRGVEGELWEIWSNIARDNPDAATRVIDAVYDTFLTIAAHPRAGTARKFKDSRLRGIRSITVTGFSNYIVFYRPAPEGVQIHHVFHGARDLDALLGEK